MSEDDPRLTFIPIEEAKDSPDGLVWCRKNMWWVVHPEKGLVIYMKHSPQCNRNKASAEHLMSRMYPWAECRFLECVFTRAEES